MWLEASTSEGMGPGDPITRFFRLIRFSHTIFALPFALGALVVAANGWPSSRILLLVIACMVFARTAAMLFNRLVDWSLDQRNPRTDTRHLLISKLSAQLLLVLSSAGFVLTASAINWLTFVLAPVALALIFFYSVTKRFTSATHFFLGLALAVAPIGAWIAQTGRIDIAPLVLAAGVICWVSGFDLIYATQDHDFDRREGIRSLVVKLGIARSLAPRAALASAHVCCAYCFWRRRKTWRALLLAAASDRRSARLRT